MSTLQGVIQHLRQGQTLNEDQINELERLLRALAAEGWAGLIPADAAVKVLADKANTFGSVNTLATFDELSSRAERVWAEHIRAFRVTATLYRVPSVSSRRYKHPSRDPRRRKGLLHTKRKWHFVTCVRLADGHIRYMCNGPYCQWKLDGYSSTVCKHALAVVRRHMCNPHEADEVTGVPTI